MRDGGAQAIMFLRRFRPRRPWTLISEGQKGAPRVSTFGIQPSEIDEAQRWIAGAQLRQIGVSVCVGELPEGVNRPFTDEELVASSVLMVSVGRVGPGEAMAAWRPIGEPSAIIHLGPRVALIYVLKSVVPIGTARAALDRLVETMKGLDARPAWLLPVPGTFRPQLLAAVRVIQHDPARLYSVEQLMSAKGSQSAAQGLTARKASSIAPAPLHWIWRNRIPAGYMNFAGHGGTGKTTGAIALASIISRGGNWPDGTLAPLGSAMILETEDPIAEVVIPRFHAAGANLDKITVVQQGDSVVTVGQLDEIAKDIPDLRLVILSPVRKLIGDNNYTEFQVKSALEPIKNWAEARKLAVIGILHPPKGSTKETADAFAGSAGYVTLARMNWLASIDRTDDTPSDRMKRRKVITVKTNIAPEGLGSLYRIVTARAGELETSRTEWLGEIDESVVLGGEDAPRRAQAAPASNVIEGRFRPLASQAAASAAVIEDEGGRVRPWLVAQLQGGPRAAEEIKAAAAAAGISQSQLYRVAKELRVAKTRSNGGALMWGLGEVT